MVSGIDEDDYHETGLHEEFIATSEFKEYKFTASDTAKGKNRIGFVLSTEKGSLAIKDMTLTANTHSEFDVQLKLAKARSSSLG